jgi:hypothetical protein
LPLTLVILRRRFLSPKDLTTTAAKKEAKTTQELVKLGWFGRFVLLLGRFSTGSSLSLPVPTTLIWLTTVFHFVPHLTRKSLIVNNKLEGRVPTVGLIQQSASTCG